MKKVFFLFVGLLITTQIFTQHVPANDTCPPVPWVLVEVPSPPTSALISWDKPCDTCEVIKYKLYLVRDFDVCEGETPSDGFHHHRAFVIGTSFYDSQWGPNAPGYYAFALKAVYDSCESDWIYSNILYHYIPNDYYSLTVNVSVENGENPEGATVSVAGATLCTDSLSYFDQSNTEGYTYFEEVLNGKYNMIISKPGYITDSISDFILWKDSTIMVELQLGPDPPPADFLVNAHNGMASWSLPTLKKNNNTLLYFKIKLENSLVAKLGPEVNSYQFQSLIQNTEYTASISAFYDWGDSESISTTFTTNFLGVNAYDVSTLVNIYPNPTNNKINIYNKSTEAIEKIRIVNHVGHTVFYSAEVTDQIDISNIRTGIYIVELECQNKLIRRKLIVK